MHKRCFIAVFAFVLRLDLLHNSFSNNSVVSDEVENLR